MSKNKKHILIISQCFYPEDFKSNDIAFDLVKRGYSVSVLTGIPNYPKGKFYKGYGLFNKRIQTLNGVKIYRALVFPRLSGRGIFLALNYLSWAFFASFWALFLSIFNKYDSIIVHETSPITQGIPAIIVKKIRKIPIFFWVLDLWPESLVSAGGINNKTILSIFYKLTQYLYKESDKILISSKGFETSILEKGDYKNKLIYYPNWAEDVFTENITLREDLLPVLPQGFIVMFAGNIGEAQDFESIMESALLLRENTSIKFIFIGDGRKKAWLDSVILENSLASTCFCFGRYPLDTMPLFFRKADVMLVSLKDELIFNLTVPAKIQAYMASSKPILAMLNGEGNKLIKDANCGLSTDAGNSQDLSDNILKLFDMEKSNLEQLGLNGYKYFTEHFNKSKCIDDLVELLENNNIKH